MLRERVLLAAACVLTGTLAGCATSRPPTDVPPAAQLPASLPTEPIPRQEPRSRYGNGPYYQVLGQRYEVMKSETGYSERGVASWYGKKFHGKATSSRETYDMYAMTAAHKTLPLPSYVRVTNLRNSKSVIVRVNDRGPFVSNRIIDLSYAAAERLDMIRDGTTLVEVTAIGYEELESDEPARQVRLDSPAEILPPDASIYVQVGAFGDAENARRRHSMLRDSGIGTAFVHEDAAGSRALYRVRIGPIANVSEYDSIVEQLQRLGISETHLVTE
ncbi:MAG TPA: septal ring lytic transglycosylase RlpA family protein [Woeseiaceae bacterium]|nr:septal ring lytic transglycosylase RlpA family protein [Woeseiaceae bacterium]